jgi:glutathione S-transferase
MTLPILYGNRESGHAYKVRLALTLLGIEHEYRSVDLDQPREQRRADFRAVSPYGEVPVLVNDGVPLAQSNAILLHLARRTGRLGGELDQNLLTQWLFWEANRIGLSVPNLRGVLKWAPQTPDAVKSWLRARAVADLAHLDRELAAKPFSLGRSATVVDVSCSGYLFWADQAEIDLRAWPAVVAWLDRIRALPNWAAPYELMSQAAPPSGWSS